MKRQRPAARPANLSAHARHANYCRAIVPVDGSGIRRKIKKDYEKALRDLEKSRQQVEDYHQKDVPQFTRWLNSNFGVLLTELRDLARKIDADEELIFQVETAAMFAGSCARAYKEIMEMRENPQTHQPPPQGQRAEKNEEPFGPGPEFADPDDESDPFKAFFDDFDAIFEERDPRRQDSRPSAPAKLKELYRALVRRLHPDTQQKMTSQKAEWWHQAQIAYEAGDVDQLEIILTLCEIDDAGTTQHTSASLLQRITAEVKKSLREMKRQLTNLRRDPAWHFASRTDRDGMAEIMRAQLTADLQRMREHWQHTQKRIAQWKSGAERSKSSRRRKNHSSEVLFPF